MDALRDDAGRDTNTGFPVISLSLRPVPTCGSAPHTIGFNAQKFSRIFVCHESVPGIFIHAITYDLAHDRTEIIMGNTFPQTDELYQPEPALQLVPVTPFQGNALRGGRPSMYHAKERSTC